jgi:catechol 2,3-dioxygenase-like lactoylglutathione lyase family enzyme
MHHAVMVNAAFEHIALNVRDKTAVVEWYVRHLGLQVVRDVPGKMAFLADAHGVVMMEVYSNPNAGQLDFAATDPLAVHVAFEVEDPAAAAEELVGAGASIHDPFKTAGDDTMVMLRDPFGIGLQLIRRGTPMRGRAAAPGSTE